MYSNRFYVHHACLYTSLCLSLCIYIYIYICIYIYIYIYTCAHKYTCMQYGCDCRRPRAHELPLPVPLRVSMFLCGCLYLYSYDMYPYLDGAGVFNVPNRACAPMCKHARAALIKTILAQSTFNLRPSLHMQNVCKSKHASEVEDAADIDRKQDDIYIYIYMYIYI